MNGKIIEVGHSDIVPALRYAALELVRLLPDKPREKTPAELEEEKRIADVERAERNRRWHTRVGNEYEPEQWDDVNSDSEVGDGS